MTVNARAQAELGGKDPVPITICPPGNAAGSEPPTPCLSVRYDRVREDDKQLITPRPAWSASRMSAPNHTWRTPARRPR